MRALAGREPLLSVGNLHAGYGSMEVLHGVDLHVAPGQSLCLIGPNGAGKSTVLNAVYGLTDVSSGSVTISGRDITRLRPDMRLREARVAYLLQDSSVFPEMSVEENLWLGGYLLPSEREARAAAQRILERYPALARRRREPARVLSGGERRLLEISRAVMMDPRILLVDEPSIGLEPRHVELVFGMLRDLQQREGRAIVVVEQNVRKGLEFADIGCLMVSGKIVLAGRRREMLDDPAVARMFLGGDRDFAGG